MSMLKPPTIQTEIKFALRVMLSFAPPQLVFLKQVTCNSIHLYLLGRCKLSIKLKWEIMSRSSVCSRLNSGETMNTFISLIKREVSTLSGCQKQSRANTLLCLPLLLVKKPTELRMLQKNKFWRRSLITCIRSTLKFKKI